MSETNECDTAAISPSWLEQYSETGYHAYRIRITNSDKQYWVKVNIAAVLSRRSFIRANKRLEQLSRA